MKYRMYHVLLLISYTEPLLAAIDTKQLKERHLHQGVWECVACTLVPKSLGDHLVFYKPENCNYPIVLIQKQNPLSQKSAIIQKAHEGEQSLLKSIQKLEETLSPDEAKIPTKLAQGGLHWAHAYCNGCIEIREIKQHAFIVGNRGSSDDHVLIKQGAPVIAMCFSEAQGGHTPYFAALIETSLNISPKGDDRSLMIWRYNPA